MRVSVAVPAPRRLRQIEFIGDSYTAGYGNMSDTRTCSKAEVHDRTTVACGECKKHQCNN